MKTLLFFFIVILAIPYNIFAHERIQGELIIWLNEKCRFHRIEKFENNYSESGLKRKRELSPRFNIWLFSFNHELVDSEDFLSVIKKDDYVKEAQFNHKVDERETFPNDQFFNNQWGLRNTGQTGGLAGADIKAVNAWYYTTGGLTQDGKEIVVAVIDSGFALNHQDINWWVNSNEINGTGEDDDGNGYIDDYYGWNAYNNSGVLPVTNHGTHVSGIIGAIGNNLIGVSGVGWDIKVMAIAGSSGSNEAVVVAAYNYALENRILYNETNGQVGAFVVATNSSFGINYGNPDNFPIWGEMYNLMGEAGILSTAATMNINADVDIVGDVPTAFPSPYLLGVTNTNHNDLKNNSAAYGANTIDLGAPGTSIYSTTSNLSYGYSTGTSMAAPHVAGVIGLMYSAMPEQLLIAYEDNPGDLALLVKNALLDGVDIIPALENITISGGRLNAHQAVLNIMASFGLAAPQGLTFNFYENSVILDWQHDEINSIDGFNIYLDEEIIYFTNQNQFTYNNIEFATLYQFAVSAVSNDYESELSLISVPATRYGDLHRSGNIEPNDAAAVLQYFVGLDPIPHIDSTPWESLTYTIADVDGNGYVQPYDASLILRYYTNLIDIFPIEDGRHHSEKIPPVVDLIYDDGFIFLNAEGELFSVGLKLPINNDITYDNVNLINDRYLLATNTSSSNLRIGLIIDQPILEKHTVLKIPLEFSNNQYLDYEILVNNRESSLSSIKILNTNNDSSEPISTGITNIYPNPFNPTVIIGFYLPEPELVKIDIFNTRGQLIANILTETADAGHHSIEWNSSSMRNDISSGIYIVQLKTPSHHFSRKVLLLK